MPTHPNCASSHQDNRLKVCGPCGKKIILGQKSYNNFQLTVTHQKLIEKYMKTNYDLKDERFPLSICATCRLVLLQHKNNDFKRPLPTMPNYENILLPKITRTNNASTEVGSTCNCYICLTGRSKTHSRNTTEVKKVSTKITARNGLYGSQHSKIKSLSKVQTSVHSNTITICKVCKTEVHKGKRHTCSKRDHVARKNVVKLVDQLPNQQQEYIASKIVNEKAKSNGTDSITLNTQGRRKRIFLKEKNTAVTFSSEDLDNYHTNTGYSIRHMNKLTTFIRYSAGRKSVPAHYSQHVSEQTKLLKDFYEVDILEFDINSNKKEMRPVVWADAEKLLETVLERRNFVGNYLVKVMADGGQGFFKICLSIIPHTPTETDLENDIPKKQRRIDSQSCVKTSETSVKKLIMLCIVPEVKESYENIKLLFNLVNINKISFKFVSDFKILLIVNGQQTATSMYPCPYCFVSLQDLRKFVNEDHVSEEVEALPLKTYGDLKEDYDKFVSLGKDNKLAKNCHSTINEPLFKEEKDLLILDKCTIPELHILQGFVNHLFWDGLVRLVGREKALLWPLKLKVVSKNYHGEVFEGNACRKLLREADKLFDREIFVDVGPFAITPYVTAFKIMNKIVDSCFSVKKLDSIANVGKLIKELRSALLSTHTTETLKMHVLLQHLIQCLELLNTQSLGLWSEQAGEAAHREFLTFWDRRKINLITDTSYPQRLKDATVEFSSLHI